MNNPTGHSSDPMCVAVEEQFQVLSSLGSLPDSVPLATKDDEISRIFTTITVSNDAELQWPVGVSSTSGWTYSPVKMCITMVADLRISCVVPLDRIW